MIIIFCSIPEKHESGELIYSWESWWRPDFKPGVNSVGILFLIFFYLFIYLFIYLLFKDTTNYLFLPMYAGYSTRLSKYYIFLVPISRFIFFNFVVISFTYLNFFRSKYWQPYVQPGMGVLLSSPPIPWIMYKLFVVFVTAQSNIRQWPVSLRNSSHYKIISMHPPCPFQPEPIHVINTITLI